MGERRGTKALETWCRRVTQGYPGVKVENMTTSWRDGLAFCAMIHHFRPDLIDFTRLDKSDIYGNNELAFRIAERHLGIPALLDAEDMAEYPVPDRLSILTYLSQFYQAFASNSSSPIKKPTLDSPESSLVSSFEGNVQQTTKIEEGSTLPWREPCIVCNLPVFIAQKLRIDGKLYHRTCFRCARCSTQLTLADYYETHDGQYCCETCPDEIIMEQTNILQKKLKNENEIDEIVEEQQKFIYEDDEQPLKSLPPEPPPFPSKIVNNDPINIIKQPSPSLVAIRRMMFDSYNKDTDDAKLIINKKDLSCNTDSSSHIIKCSKEEIIVNNNINNKNSNNEDIINKSIIDVKDTHQLAEIIHTDIDSNSDNVECVNKESDDTMYKNNSNKCLQPDKSSDNDTTEEVALVDSVQVSGNSNNEENVNINIDPIDKIIKDNDEDESIKCNSEDTSIKDNAEDPSIKDNAEDPSVKDNAEDESIKGNSDDTSIRDNAEDTSIKDNDEDKSIKGNSEDTRIKDNAEDPSIKDNAEDTSIKDNAEDISVKNVDEDNTIKSINEDSSALDHENVITIKETEHKTAQNIVNSLEELPSTESKVDKTVNTIVKETSTNSIEYPDDLNPFSDEEEDDEGVKTMDHDKKISTNPFGSDSEDDEEHIQPKNNTLKEITQSSTMQKSSSLNPFESDDDDDEVMKPVPLPRKNVLSPEPIPFPRNRLRGSLRSINSLSSTCSLPTPRKKKPAPQPPSTPSSTLSRSPRARKNRRAPLPPTSSTQSIQSETVSIENTSSTDISCEVQNETEETITEIAKEITSIIGMISNMADAKEEMDESNVVNTSINSIKVEDNEETTIKTVDTTELLIKSNELAQLEKEIIHSPKRNSIQCDEFSTVQSGIKESLSGPRSLTESVGNVSYMSESNSSFGESLSSPPSEKKNKDSANLHRKISESGSVYLSKSSHGQWRRKKPPAPPLPPKKRPVHPMPIQNIRQELYDIEIKQQGLERQGVTLENKIRDKFDSESTITPYIEEMVLQLFELVNEKNELFRKQAELMYLRRQHHLEEEHSELEYQIRCLMARPEANKTDSDKELEEQLIQRLVEVVGRRDAIVQCLEMDRLREAEEDRSINTQLGIFTLAVAKEAKITPKKKHKKNKDKHNTMKMVDLDKDLDDSEKDSKKKKKWFTLHHAKGKH